MKRLGDSADQELEMFFAELKHQDSKIAISAYKKRTPSRIWKLLPLGIAASVLLGFWIWNQEEKEVPLYQDLIIISLVEGENQEQKFVIEQVASMDVWESPTASLLDTY